MKITDVRPFVVFSPELGRNFTFVRISTDEGLTGLGESGANRKEAAVAGLVESWASHLIGQDPTRIEHIWQTLWRGQFFRGGHVHSSALAAIDIALWDLRAKSLGVPVYDLLGGRVREYARCYCHVHGKGRGTAGIDSMVADATSRISEGWDVIRFDVEDWGESSRRGVLDQGRAVAWTVDAFAALREACGEEVEICIDFHQRLTPANAVRLAKALEPFRPFFIEDPIRPESPDVYRSLRQQISSPIATGEQIASKWEWQTLIEGDLMNYCRIDLGICGGLTEARKVAAWCETHFIEQAPHNPLGPIATAACLHFDLSTPLFAVQELVWRPEVIPGIVQTDMRLEGGKLFSGGAPGLGVELNEPAALESPFQPVPWPILHRDDGSVTDW